jgi:hypothetical protein
MPNFKSADPVEVDVSPGVEFEVKVDGVAATISSITEESDGLNEQSEGSMADGDRMAYFGSAHRLKITPASATGRYNVTKKQYRGER